MPKSFSYFDFIAYIFSGVPILLALDYCVLSGQITHSSVVQDSGVVMATFVLLTMALVIGNINSTIAHWLFQEGGFSWLFGRPSAHLLNERPRVMVRRITYCKSLESSEIDRIYQRARMEYGGSEVNHKVVWSLAFRNARLDSWFQEAHEQLLLTVHFSRNMHTALMLSALIIAYGTWVGTNEASLSSKLVLIVLTLVGADLLFIRFLVAIRSYSKQVLKHYGRTADPLRRPGGDFVIRLKVPPNTDIGLEPVGAVGPVSSTGSTRAPLKPQETR